MTSNSAGVMKLPLCLKVCGASKFWRLKSAKVHANFIDLNAGPPVVSISGNTERAVTIVGSTLPDVLYVLALRNITQVCNSVVAWVSVNVVNAKFRPFAIDIKPRNAMLFDFLAANPNVSVSVFANVSGNVANIDPVGRSDLAREYAGQWIVMKKFAQAFCGKIGVSHDAVLSLIGQRPVSVDSTCWPRHFTAFKSVGVIA